MNNPTHTQTQKQTKQTNKMSYDNDEEDDDQPQNITEEMEQKRLEEAAASVE